MTDLSGSPLDGETAFVSQLLSVQTANAAGTKTHISSKNKQLKTPMAE
jgi:hypothetical protein